uniref:Ephrin RBD domain-containing protein n=1 Tax=Ciona savignyi TaxID=51511 RepID=H2Z3R3_CIOSA
MVTCFRKMKFGFNFHLFSFLLGYVISVASGCSELHRERQSVEVRAQTAQTIVYAQAIKMYPVSNASGKSSDTVYTTEFRLICPLKNINIVQELEEQSIHRAEGHEDDLYFNVTEMGYNSGWCLKIEAIIGKTYFIFIRPLEEVEREKEQPLFVPDLVNMQSPIINDTHEHRIKLEEFISEGECSLPNMEEEIGWGGSHRPQEHWREHETEHSQEHEYIQSNEHTEEHDRNTTLPEDEDSGNTGKRELSTGHPHHHPRILNGPTPSMPSVRNTSVIYRETTPSGCKGIRQTFMLVANCLIILYIIA